MTQVYDGFLHYSTGYKHLAGMIRGGMNGVLTRTFLCSWSGTLEGRLFRHDNESFCYPFASFGSSRITGRSVKAAVNSTRHAAICWLFGEPQSAAVVVHLTVRLPELSARGSYRASPLQIYKQTTFRANKTSGEQSKRINEVFFL
jgi:hypothetical protein